MECNKVKCDICKALKEENKRLKKKLKELEEENKKLRGFIGEMYEPVR